MSTPDKHKDLASLELWLNTKRPYMEVSKKVWRKIEGDAPIFDENLAKYSEWTEGPYVYRGMRNTSGQKHGIVRTMNTLSGNYLYEACYKNDSLHGLCLWWHTNGLFYAGIHQNGSNKGYIIWDKNWSEYSSNNKAYCLELFSIDDFKP